MWDNLPLHERKSREAALHSSDWMDGTPLDIGDGYSVAMHSCMCAYCYARQLAIYQKRIAEFEADIEQRGVS